MNDARAKRMIADARLPYVKGSAWEEWYAHMAQAIEDRAALVALCDGAIPRPEGYKSDTVEAARRHMDGKP